MTREDRRAKLAQELGDIVPDETPKAPETALPTGNISMTAADLMAIVTAAVQAAGGGNGDIGSQITRALRDNRQPIPENTDAAYHRMSHNHPGGKDVPRPALTYPTFFGVWDAANGKAAAFAEIEDDQCRDGEIEALNALRPGLFNVERNDGGTVMVRVVDAKDAQENVIRRILAFPQQQFEKEHMNTLPTLEKLARQMVAVI